MLTQHAKLDHHYDSINIHGANNYCGQEWCVTPGGNTDRGDVYQATAAIETIEHYGTYLFLLMYEC